MIISYYCKLPKLSLKDFQKYSFTDYIRVVHSYIQTYLTYIVLKCWSYYHVIFISFLVTVSKVYFIKAVYGYYDLNISDYVSFVSHSRTRNCVNPSLMLKVPLCKTSIHSSIRTLAVSLLFGTVCVELLNLQT
jgi:hypothetical protein